MNYEFIIVFTTFALVLGLCFLGLGIKIFFSKEGKFPETEIGHNKEMRKRGIVCTRQEEILQWKKLHRKNVNEPLPCEGCGLIEQCEDGRQ
jgi:hypothetical protein